MGDLVKQILAKPIQLTDQVVKATDEAAKFKQECGELKSKAEKLAGLLRQAARASSDLYETPTRRMVEDTEQVLEKALALALKCRGQGLVQRVFTIIPAAAAAFRKLCSQLENSASDVSWLLRVSAPADDRADEYLGLPPMAANEPILGLIWEQIATLCTGSPDVRAEAAAYLVSLARNNDRNRKLIIEEGGVSPLLRLIKEGGPKGQENAAHAIGLLGRDPESVGHMVHMGVCSIFAKVLKDGPMRAQAEVAWAVSELVVHYPKAQDLFAQHNIIRLLVSHLAFETIQEHSKYAVTSKATSIHAAAVVLASNNNNHINHNQENINDDDKGIFLPHPSGNKNPNQMYNVVTSTMSIKPGTNVKIPARTNGSHHHQPAREAEDPETKAYIKAMCARALCHLARGNPGICRSITESRALLCFAALLEKGEVEVRRQSAAALTEITAVAEGDAELRRSAFRPTSPACRAVVDQLLEAVGLADTELLVPCVKAVGNLARTFKATETRMIGPLVRLLDEREAEVSREACVALVKFACSENYLHMDHCKAIVGAGGAKHLVQLVYFGEQTGVQTAALVLLCYVAMHVPDSEELAQAEVLALLEWASKQATLVQVELVERLLPEAKGKLEVYQSRGSRGYH